MSQLLKCDICCISFAEEGFVIYDSAADFIAHFNQLRQMNSSLIGQCSDYAFSKGLMCFNCTYISRLLFCSIANNRHEMMCGVLGMRLVSMRRLWCNLMHMQQLSSYLHSLLKLAHCSQKIETIHEYISLPTLFVKKKKNLNDYWK